MKKKKSIIPIFTILTISALAGCLVQKQSEKVEQNQLSQQSSITPTSTSIPTPTPKNTKVANYKNEYTITKDDFYYKDNQLVYSDELVDFVMSFEMFADYTEEQIRKFIESKQFADSVKSGIYDGDLQKSLFYDFYNFGDYKIKVALGITPKNILTFTPTPTVAPEPTAATTPVPTATPSPEPANTPVPTNTPTPTPVIKAEPETSSEKEKTDNMKDFTYKTPITADLTYEEYSYIMKLREEHYGMSSMSVSEMEIVEMITEQYLLSLPKDTRDYKLQTDNKNPVIIDPVSRRQAKIGSGTKEKFTIEIEENEVKKEITLENVSGDYIEMFGKVFFIPDGLGESFEKVYASSDEELWAWADKYPDYSYTYNYDENGDITGGTLYMHDGGEMSGHIFDLELRGY